MPGMFLSILLLKSGCLSLVIISKVSGRAVFRDRSQLDRCGGETSEHFSEQQLSSDFRSLSAVV